MTIVWFARFYFTLCDTTYYFYREVREDEEEGKTGDQNSEQEAGSSTGQLISLIDALKNSYYILSISSYRMCQGHSINMENFLEKKKIFFFSKFFL